MSHRTGRLASLIRSPRHWLLGLGALAAFAGTAPQARADGALAIGNCGAYGYSYNYNTENEARERALRECQQHGGKNCKVVVSINGNCAAFAIDDAKTCGAWGWASRSTRSAAEDVAINECTKAGGRRCKIRAQVCDSKSAPAMTTNWTSTNLEQNECVDRAGRVMKDAGLSKNFETVGQSTFGEEGDYTAQIRCIADQNIVMFVVVGPTLDHARELMQSMFDKF